MDPLIATKIGTLWEWGALVGLLLSIVIVLCYVCKILYNRNVKQGDDMLAALQENTKVLTQIRKELEDAK